MNRTLLNPSTILAVALSIIFASGAKAQNCTQPPGGALSLAWAWGANQFGALGDGTAGFGVFPVMQVQKLEGVVAVSAGTFHSLALRNDGTVWAWGDNTVGELGDWTTTARYLPVRVQNLIGVTAIAASDDYSLALKNDGTVWAWGYNGNGELGDGTFVDRHLPVQVQGLDGVTAIAATVFHSLALRNDGTVWAWGENTYGEIGDGTSGNFRNRPVEVQNLSAVTAIAAGAFRSLAVENDGTAWAWGENALGELGDGTTIDRYIPVQVQNLSAVRAISSGEAHSLALKNDGTVWAWGENNVGELGDGTTINRGLPVQVQGLSGVTAVSAGATHSLALKSDCTIWGWGQNSNDQLGYGPTSPQLTPVQVPNISLVTAISAGNGYSEDSLAVAHVVLTQLTITEILMHPNQSHLDRFNLKLDGVIVDANVNSGSTEPLPVNPGIHTVSETGGTGTVLSEFSTVIGGDCAANGTVTLALGDQKTCTITNYDHWGGCASRTFCCQPGAGTQGCQRCSRPGLQCP